MLLLKPAEYSSGELAAPGNISAKMLREIHKQFHVFQHVVKMYSNSPIFKREISSGNKNEHISLLFLNIDES